MKSYSTVKKCMGGLISKVKYEQMKNALILNGYKQIMNWKL